MTGHDVRQETIRNMKNRDSLSGEGGFFYYCPVEKIFYNKCYSHEKHTNMPLCPRRHRLIIMPALSTE